MNTKDNYEDIMTSIDRSQANQDVMQHNLYYRDAASFHQDKSFKFGKIEAKHVGVPERFFKAATSKINLPQDKKEEIIAWIESKKGNLFISGATGRGKTYTSVALMYFLEAKKGIPWNEQRFVEVHDLNQEWLSNRENPTLNSNKAESLKSCKLLVLDDLGTKKLSDAFLDYLFWIINDRCNRPDLMTIYTTNLSNKELHETFGPRIVSRITDRTIIVFDPEGGPDLRRNLHLREEPKIVSIR